jgi:hypothetical protein
VSANVGSKKVRKVREIPFSGNSVSVVEFSSRNCEGVPFSITP